MKALTDKEMILLEFVRSLTKESAEKFYTLVYQYAFKCRNSEEFKDLCRRQNKSGFNSFTIWLKKHHFEPVYKEQF